MSGTVKIRLEPGSGADSLDFIDWIWGSSAFDVQLPVELVDDDRDRRITLDDGRGCRRNIQGIGAVGAAANEPVAFRRVDRAAQCGYQPVDQLRDRMAPIMAHVSSKKVHLGRGELEPRGRRKAEVRK